ncbi:hypothetical protein ACFQZO_14410 [Bradyrhizobium sp. GCM10027634]|uniref:hypothetical protein n=1 Tax=unclassified Bradyrhizobium TaxID=2631580 RepID=UPI00188CE328|nr:MULTISPECIES: hypothetical protein [unclassified Bradyrhizobium]MDN5002079.1 hypothetical protein [Bradyrhizobium sp. WYCCWR 12677]QOZ45657.1 hypothetical protein XH89_20850 [Bradyrhizobium sp. CCBAU 53340]
MRKIAIAILFAVIAGPALAQDHVPQYHEEATPKTESEKAAERQAERAYQRSLNNVPDQKPVDPWGAARGDDVSKKPAVPAKPAVKHSSKPKSGGTVN